MTDKIKRILHKVFFGLGRGSQVFRYILAGGAGASTDIFSLYILKGVLDFPLLLSVALAFLAGFVVSFLSQKYWTFIDHSSEKVHKQAATYFVVTLANFFLNILGMHLLVTVLGIWYLLAKVIVSGIIAVSSFFLYKYLIFKKSSLSQEISDDHTSSE